MAGLNMAVLLLLTVLGCTFVFAEHNPGDLASSFILPTLSGPLVYKSVNNTNIKPPIIFHEYTSHSGFLDALWYDDASIMELLQHSPNNTQYVFFSSDADAVKTAQWMKGRIKEVINKHFISLQSKSDSGKDTAGQKRFFSQARTFLKPFRGIFRRSVEQDIPSVSVAETMKGVSEDLHHFYAMGKLPRSVNIEKETAVDNDEFATTESNVAKSSISSEHFEVNEHDKKAYLNSWLERLHFVTIPVYQFGNWIPLVTSRWYCSGHGCGLDQISFETKNDGDILFVAKRLDARYDWLPSPYTLKSKHPKAKIINYGDGCKVKDDDTDAESSIILVSRKGKCSFFDKVQIGMKIKALAVIVYSEKNNSLTDMTCVNEECAKESNIPGTMITFQSGQKILALLAQGKNVYVRFQHTPTRNFFLAIDEQGKLQEVGWLLFPSMRFLTYQAEWLNYKTELLQKIANMTKTINIFNPMIMHGKTGVVKSVKLPSLEELQMYNQVYLDMSLGCPGNTDFSCPHWDHTVQLFLDCGSGELAGEEIGRWITPFRRRIGRWLTSIKPLIPLFTSTNCTFVMKTVPWAMAWKPSLRIQLSSKIPKGSTAFVPYKITKLFRGGTFDKDYNKRYKAKEFIVPANAKKVKLFAVITGHGSDNNNCAEFCVTSHNFIINKKFTNTRIFSNAGTPTGCADKVRKGVEPNEHGTWLYGRDGWCDGQEVDPWLEDITDQVKLNEKINTISYHGYFNGKDPAPESNPGYIIMHSFLVFYKEIQVDK